MKFPTKRLAAVIVSLVMLFGIMIIVPAEDSEIDSIKDKISAAQEKIDSAEEKLDSLEGDISKTKDYISELDSQISAYQTQIDAYSEQIEEYEAESKELDTEKKKLEADIVELNRKIDGYNKRVDYLNTQIDGKMDQLKEILRANLLTGETSALEILLTSEDFAEYLTKTQMMSSIADRQDTIIQGINGDIDKVNSVIIQVKESKEQVETYKEEVADKIENIKVLSEQIADSQAEVEAKRAKVQEKVDESNSYLSQLNSQSAEYQDMITGYETDIAAFESEISSILQRRAAERAAAQQSNSGGEGSSSSDGDSGSSSSYSGGSYTGTGNFGAPLSIGGQYVSSGYYYRTNPVTGASEHHGGLDIAAPNIYGASIYACDNGEVATATYHYSWGNYVLIDHGNGYATLYAHMSSIAVSEGQSVSKGQVIGYVGSTGYATGPHLHIEVWINGSRTDPSPYIPVG